LCSGDWTVGATPRGPGRLGLRRLPLRPGRNDFVYFADRRIYPAGHLQRGDSGEAGLPDRGASAAGPGRPVQSWPADGRSTGRGRRPAMTDLVIDVRDLQKSFGARRIVHGLNLQVGSGEVCGFLGANGSGKTTTIRLLCGLLTPDNGSGTCLGLDIIA